MEEFENKLHCDNSVIISQLISGLVNNIIKKGIDKNKELPELKLLKEKCICNDNAVNLVACNAVLQLVKNGLLEIKATLTDFISIITTTNRYNPNVAFLFNNLLLLDMDNEVTRSGSYKCQYNLRLPQHPFIVMLNDNPNMWSSIFQEIVHSSSILRYSETYEPVYIYTICDPNENQGLSTFKQKLWTFILHNETPEGNHDIIYTLLSWMQLERRELVQINSELLAELSDVNIDRNIVDPDLLLLFQSSALHYLILNNFDPRELFTSIEDVLKFHDDLKILTPVLLILAKTIPVCSSVYLEGLLKICKVVIKRIHHGSVVFEVMKSSLLHWIANQSLLAEASVKLANEIVTLLSNKPKKLKTGLNKHQEFVVKFAKILNTNSEIHLAVELCVILEKWKSNHDVVNFIQKLESTSNHFLIRTIHFLFGLFLTEFNDTQLHLKIFNLIIRCCEHNRKLTANLLTLILYKLTNTTDPQLHFQLLKALPKMAVIKENQYKVINTIQALSEGPKTLKILSNTLMFDLWKIENKCYPYLEKLLTVPVGSQCDKWEFYVIRAYILKELCALKPELYGKELVAHLSKILNECHTDDGALACALAIEGITSLCKFEIIDAVTTWATLAPLLKDERRTSVIKSICGLIHEIPSLSYTEAYPKLIEDVVAKLWEFITLHVDKEVWEAAFDALTAFSLEQIISQMTDKYLDEETLTLRRSGHPIPGQCWIEFLKNCDQAMMRVAGDFLIKLVSLEVAGYLKFVYQVKGPREPIDYSYLPLNSVVKGLAFHVKSKVTKWKTDIYREVYLECLRILSQEYSKPLPPLDWCFLQELVHEPEAKNYCINIASHQVMISGTARRFIVNYIEAITGSSTEPSDVLNICKNLKFLANSVQPFTLRPFVEKTITIATESHKNGNEEQLLSILEDLKETLRDQNIQELNKNVIAEIVCGILQETDSSSELFQVLLDPVVLLPSKYHPKCIKEMNLESFQKTVKIKTKLALQAKTSPLTHLNELIEIGSNYSKATRYVFEEFARVFNHHKDNTECVLWIFELIGQIQATIVDKYEENHLLYLCDIFILATVVFSGHFVLLDDFSKKGEMIELFPTAIATLLDVNHWSICTAQALEWFYHMTVEDTFPQEYREMSKQCLQALRHDQEFRKNMKWMKYLNVAC